MATTGTGTGTGTGAGAGAGTEAAGTPPTAASSSAVAPKQPPPDQASFWNEQQWQVWWALMEAILPPVTDESSVQDAAQQITIPDAKYSRTFKHLQTVLSNPPTEDQFRQWLDYNGVQDPVFRNNIVASVAALPLHSQKAIGGILSLLSTHLGSLWLTWSWTPLHRQSVPFRESMMRSWLTSRMRFLPHLAKAFSIIAQKSFLVTNTLFKDITGYTDLPHNHKPVQDSFEFEFMQFDPPPPPPAAAAAAATAEPVTLETDVVIVGSGCGGAVCAKKLSEAGHRVIVVDKGYHFPPAQLPMSQETGGTYLYDNGGVCMTDDAAISAVSGSCWGGGGTVNWSVSLQTQDFVRKEWAEKSGLPFFVSDEYQKCMDRVGEVMGAGTKAIRHNHANRVMLGGSEKLGWKAEAVPQNTGGEAHNCARCHLGCGTSGKKGPAVSWLPAAARAGARFIEGLQVERVTFDEEGGMARTATGIVGRWVSRDAEGGVGSLPEERTTREVVIRAKKVIVSSGTIQSPLLLKRSEVKNENIGKNLHLHPCKFVSGRWKEKTEWMEGAIITSCCSEHENLDNQGHGVKLEPMCQVPYSSMSTSPWRSGLDFKLQALTWPHLNYYICMVRDRDSGTVYPDPVTGKPRISYTLSAVDRAHMVEGVIAMAKICYVQGAREIDPAFFGVEPFVREELAGSSGGLKEADVNDPAFVAWLARVKDVGNRPSEGLLASAHQMGTCRMAYDEKEGVVDAKGKVFGTEGLYVADASVFPSASGVNPMITCMAIADWIAAGVTSELDALGRA